MGLINIMALLRQETATLHQQLERRLSPGMFTERPRYEGLLRAFFGFYEGVEKSLFDSLDGLLPDAAERHKAPWLKIDLRAVGLTDEAIGALPRCRSFPLTTPARAFGALYVLEGQTLGGAILASRIETSLQINPMNGGRFFTNYAQHRAAKWKEFGQHLTHFAEQRGETADIVSGARELFSAFDQWLEHHGH